MIKKFLAISVLMIILSGCAIGPIIDAEVEIPLPVNEKESLVFKAGGRCDKKEDFVLKKKCSRLYNMHEIKLIKSWEEYQQLRKYCVDALIFDQIIEEDFDEYLVGILIVNQCGIERVFLEKVIKRDKGYFFRYKVSEFGWMVRPKCCWSNLYLLKLKKKY